MPSGIAVTPSGRIFLSFPRWLTWPASTVAELVDGDPVPFPSELRNAIDVFDAVHRFFSVQSVVASPNETIWILDSGRPGYLPALPGAAKLVEVDVESRRLLRTIAIPCTGRDLRTYLNDVRFDFARGRGGTAYISDSGTLLSPCSLIVVDLATGVSRRRLIGHFTVQPRLAAVPVIEGRKLEYRLPLVPFGLPYQNGVDGIAVGPDGAHVYFGPLSSRTMYRVPAAVLADPDATDDDVENAVEDMGHKPISDGLACDSRGNLYLGDLENGRIVYRDSESRGAWSILVADPRFLWTDSLAIARDHVYFTINQIERMAPFRAGRDARLNPYRVYRTTLARHGRAAAVTAV